MRLTAHQPAYIPWLGLLAKIADADLFCSFDCVPMEASGYENRQRIKTQAGPLWLTVPVRRGQQTPIRDVLIANDQAWQRKHWRTIELAYHKAPYFAQYGPGFRDVLMGQEWEYLAELDEAMLRFLCTSFKITTPIVRASDHHFYGVKSALVLDMCRELGATEYVFGVCGREYADVPAFEAAGIKVEFQDYWHPTYPQLHGAFEPRMGAVDLLFNVGGEAGSLIIRAGTAYGFFIDPRIKGTPV